MEQSTIYFKQISLFDDLPLPTLDDIIFQYYPMFYAEEYIKEDCNEEKDPIQKELQF